MLKCYSFTRFPACWPFPTFPFIRYNTFYVNCTFMHPLHKQNIFICLFKTRDLKSLKTRHLHYKSHLVTNIELFPSSLRKYCPIMFQCTEKIVLLGQKAWAQMQLKISHPVYLYKCDWKSVKNFCWQKNGAYYFLLLSLKCSLLGNTAEGVYKLKFCSHH